MEDIKLRNVENKLQELKQSEKNLNTVFDRVVRHPNFRLFFQLTNDNFWTMSSVTSIISFILGNFLLLLNRSNNLNFSNYTNYWNLKRKILFRPKTIQTHAYYLLLNSQKISYFKSNFLGDEWQFTDSVVRHFGIFEFF